MDSFIGSIILAVIQGLTEWLPISSSGHLVFASSLLNFKGGVVFEVALHFGTLMAVFVYFGKDITDILQDILKGKWGTNNARIGFMLALASVPAAFVGYFALSFFDTVLSSLPVLSLGFAITGTFLLIAGMYKPKEKPLSYGRSFYVGLAQALSIVPGISRSGSTISSGLLLGLNEKDAMRFSFLMSIPIVFGASILTLGNRTLPIDYLWATLVSFAVGLLTIHLMFRYILVRRHNLVWFSLYCFIFSIIVALLYFGIL